MSAMHTHSYCIYSIYIQIHTYTCCCYVSCWKLFAETQVLVCGVRFVIKYCTFNTCKYAYKYILLLYTYIVNGNEEGKTKTKL